MNPILNLFRSLFISSSFSSFPSYGCWVCRSIPSDTIAALLSSIALWLHHNICHRSPQFIVMLSSPKISQTWHHCSESPQNGLPLICLQEFKHKIRIFVWTSQTKDCWYSRCQTLSIVNEKEFLVVVRIQYGVYHCFICGINLIHIYLPNCCRKSIL